MRVATPSSADAKSRVLELGCSDGFAPLCSTALATTRRRNVPKFVSQDMPLFNALMSDLFPGVEPPVESDSKLQNAIEEELELAGLQKVASIVRKCIRESFRSNRTPAPPPPAPATRADGRRLLAADALTHSRRSETFDSKRTRHGNMLVGSSLGGKTTVWTVLTKAMTRLKKEGIEGYEAVRTSIINPKAVPSANLYGEYDLQTFEWTDGVLAKVMREICADEKSDEKWILLDGPVDTLWIESMNTVLDDNKLLTLINGERIAMPPQVSLLFEVEDLSVASPATVSRAGMVYVDITDLGWRPYIDSWLAKMAEPQEREQLRGLVDRCLPKLLTIKATRCSEPVPVAELGCIRSLCDMYSAIATPANGVTPSEPDHYFRMIELHFLFATVCAPSRHVGSLVVVPH